MENPDKQILTNTPTLQYSITPSSFYSLFSEASMNKINTGICAGEFTAA
jgi:hypothetical protein